MLSKRTIASTFYETPCPTCGYMTVFSSSNIVQREFFPSCPTKTDYGVISYDVKCQMCLSRFSPTRHRTANFMTNPMKLYLMSPVQQSYISQMKSFAARVPPELNSIKLGQKTDELKHLPKFDTVSIFLVDEVGAVNEDMYIYITGHNLTADLLTCQLGICDIREVPVREAMDFHFRLKPQMVGDVSHVPLT